MNYIKAIKKNVNSILSGIYIVLKSHLDLFMELGSITQTPQVSTYSVTHTFITLIKKMTNPNNQYLLFSYYTASMTIEIYKIYLFNTYLITSLRCYN